MAQTYSILGDSPVDAKRDCLNFGAFVKPFAGRLIQSVDNTPFTVGILADWGQGKSTVMRMLQAAVTAEGCSTAWFEPWKYNGREAVWKGLALTLVSEIRKDKTLRSELRRKKDQMKSFAARALWSRLIGREWAQDLVDTVKSEPWSPSLLHEFEEHFETLFEHIDPRHASAPGAAKPFVLFVDDLDRCLPEAALAVLEALKLVLNRPGLITVMGVAEGELSRAVAAAYARETKDVKDTLDPDWGRKYMRKVIQMPFPLPVISEASFEDYVGACLKDSGIDTGLEGDSRWRSIIRDACQSNLREVKRFLNHLISEMDKADANEASGGKALELDPRRVAFTLLLVWRFPKFLGLIRTQVLDRELLIRYQLYFAQVALGSADASLLQDPDGEFYNDRALGAFFRQCLSTPPGLSALVVPFATWQDVEPYLQFGVRTAAVPPAPGEKPVPGQKAAPGEKATPPPSPGQSDDGPAGQPAASPSKLLVEMLDRVQTLMAAGQLEQADKEVLAAVDLAESVRDTAAQGMLWYLRGQISEARGLGEWARGYYQRALKIAEDSQSTVLQLPILLGLARTDRHAGPQGRSLEYASQARMLARERNDTLGELNALVELADSHDANGDGEQAEHAHREALALAHRIRHKPGELMVLERMSRMLRRQGRPGQDVLAQAETLALSLGDRRAMARMRIERGLVRVSEEQASGTPLARSIMYDALADAMRFVKDPADLASLRVYISDVDPLLEPALDELAGSAIRTTR